MSSIVSVYRGVPDTIFTDYTPNAWIKQGFTLDSRGYDLCSRQAVHVLLPATPAHLNARQGRSQDFLSGGAD